MVLLTAPFTLEGYIIEQFNVPLLYKYSIVALENTFNFFQASD